jgi:hypothetical protein
MATVGHPYARDTGVKSGFDASSVILGVELAILLILYAIGVDVYGPLTYNTSNPEAQSHGARVCLWFLVLPCVHGGRGVGGRFCVCLLVVSPYISRLGSCDGVYNVNLSRGCPRMFSWPLLRLLHPRRDHDLHWIWVPDDVPAALLVLRGTGAQSDST